MSIFQVTSDDIDTFTLVTNPIRTFSSSSTTGATGSVYVFARRSDTEKEVQPISSFVDSVHNDADISGLLQQVRTQVLSGGNAYAALSQYLSASAAQPQSTRVKKSLPISRYTPTFDFTKFTTAKLIVKDVMNSYYRSTMPSANWGYTNYHSLNFFSSSTVPSSSVLLYPNVETLDSSYNVSGTYVLSGAFSFDFHINPRYQQPERDGVFNAGTIFHLSSCYALSLISGSAKDENGRATGFRLALQLSHSADVPPSSAIPGGHPNDLTFWSDDNSLQLNEWHRVVVRWTGNQNGLGSGSFNINGEDRGAFVVTSHIHPAYLPGTGNPDALCIGNFYEGNNTGFNAQALFFANDTSLRDGTKKLIDTTGITEPDHYLFRHPLNAELHTLMIRNKYLTNDEISSTANTLETMPDDVRFFLSPRFITYSTVRKFDGDGGGVLQTPFFAVDGTTSDPFNVALSFGVGGHYINLENFLLDSANATLPRLFQLSASIIPQTSDVKTANEFLHDNPGVRYRNLLLLPCDDGTWNPPFDLIANFVDTKASNSQELTWLRAKRRDDLGTLDNSVISLNDLVSTASLILNQDYDRAGVTQAHAEDFMKISIGASPSDSQALPGPATMNFAKIASSSAADVRTDDFIDPGVQAGAPLTIFQRTRDASSNQVVFFNISNLYYGNRILPGSLVMRDSDLSGSGGRVSITLKDDGYGSLYRADANSKLATWNNVGNVYYDEGIIVIKSPHLYFFGADNFDISFRGEQKLHVMKVHAKAPANSMNSSSNPCYLPVSASGYPNDPDSRFVYVTNINLHDEDFNVIVKSQLAQPAVKRTGDRITFRIKMDF